MSLNVKDIKASKKFYEQLGFEVIDGKEEEKWLILKNDNCKIGLFEGMIPKNTLTFNPGWNDNAQKLESFTDVREIQKNLKSKGIDLTEETDEKTKGPGWISLVDPDGNPILIDQHV